MDAPITPPLGKILETVVYCRDLAAARDFYEGVLGLTVASADGDRHLFFALSDSMLLIFNPDQTRQQAVWIGDQMIPQHGVSGASHFAFRVNRNQLESVRARLQQEQIPVESEIRWPGGGHSLYCRDPAGNSVEFATAKLWFETQP